MNAVIRDKVVLETADPVKLAAYLRSTNWSFRGAGRNQMSVWMKNDQSSGEECEVLLPLHREFRDYALRISELLQTLEVMEQRSQLAIWSDLQIV